MEGKTLKLTCAQSKLGHSLTQISKLTGLTIDDVKERLGQATGLTPKQVSSIIFRLKQRRRGLEQISQEAGVDLEVLEQFFPKVIEETILPTFLYTSKLQRAVQGKPPHWRTVLP
jgi:hypothetical protein